MSVRIEQRQEGSCLREDLSQKWGVGGVSGIPPTQERGSGWAKERPPMPPALLPPSRTRLVGGRGGEGFPCLF